jgi:hypothetical protein
MSPTNTLANTAAAQTAANPSAGRFQAKINATTIPIDGMLCLRKAPSRSGDLDLEDAEGEQAAGNNTAGLVSRRWSAWP